MNRLPGSMLRVDATGPGVSGPLAPCALPADRRFAAHPKCGPGFSAEPCPEIHARGLRNPWRWSLDAATGSLWLADVGHNGWEMSMPAESCCCAPVSTAAATACP